MSAAPLTEAQLLALRDLAAFYQSAVGAKRQDHPLISIWDAYDDPVAELEAIIARHQAAFAPSGEETNLFEDRAPEMLTGADFETLSRMLTQEVDWARTIHEDNGLPVCGHETGLNADRLFSITARAAQMVAEADGDPSIGPTEIFHDHPYMIFLPE